MMKTTKAERDIMRRSYAALCSPTAFRLRCLDDIESLREALCQIIINTEDECDRAIAQAAVEEPR